ncbi:hypothetical protein B4U79_12974 [Dinothrombium tinctorium]|uniref:Uncharacterized protein n=1 Tax=Dinothrombium tinctorium TaxID=1965070 RepID=A0A3S3P4D5_9ACAR|nr:hypothetical protein B4U79_12974 [Dinothrombium tinctorium]
MEQKIAIQERTKRIAIRVRVRSIFIDVLSLATVYLMTIFAILESNARENRKRRSIVELETALMLNMNLNAIPEDVYKNTKFAMNSFNVKMVRTKTKKLAAIGAQKLEDICVRIQTNVSIIMKFATM